MGGAARGRGLIGGCPGRVGRFGNIAADTTRYHYWSKWRHGVRQFYVRGREYETTPMHFFFLLKEKEGKKKIPRRGENLSEHLIQLQSADTPERDPRQLQCKATKKGP